MNHNGDPELARRLIDIAADSGADAVKFQKRTPSEILIAEALASAVQRADLARRDLRRAPRATGAVRGRFSHASGPREVARDHDAGECLGRDAASSSSKISAFPAYKIASADCSNLPLIEYIGEEGEAGPALDRHERALEVDEAVATVRRHNDQLVLFQCTSTYPADNDQLNLRVIQTYKARYGCVVGYSGHERGPGADRGGRRASAPASSSDTSRSTAR